LRRFVGTTFGKLNHAVDVIRQHNPSVTGEWMMRLDRSHPRPMRGGDSSARGQRRCNVIRRNARWLLRPTVLTTLTADQAAYLGVPVEGPYKADH